jgi:hypothetical protein
VHASIKTNGSQYTIALKAAQAPAFGAYITQNLDRLYEAFRAEKQTEIGRLIRKRKRPPQRYRRGKPFSSFSSLRIALSPNHSQAFSAPVSVMGSLLPVER